jgi:hypothetical protein
MAWIHHLYGESADIQQRARLQDSSKDLIFAFMIVAACMSLLAQTICSARKL